MIRAMRKSTGREATARRRGTASRITACLVILLSLLVESASAQVYSDIPVWSSIGDSVTRAVAVGDINKDGNLDLVCGNDGQHNTLYFGDAGTFSADPSWASAVSGSTQSVALGDMNGDGYLDLVCANANEPNTIYLYDYRIGFFHQIPDWSTTETNNSLAVALADINGDGRLDVVFANSGQGNAVYLSAAGVLPDSVPQTIGPANSSTSVAVGDIDGNGHLDLAFGNDRQPNTLYQNDGIGFSLGWSSDESESNRTFDLAFGDINGDSLLDLACGNANANTVYLNDGSLLDTTPDWRSFDGRVTTSIDLGDVDADGDLDLVCGNFNGPNTLYFNNAGRLDEDPTGWEEGAQPDGNFWGTSASNKTFDVALADIGNDGDLDLVCGNAGEINTLFEMNGNILRETPTWLSRLDNSTFGIELADMDADGDLDLVCGNGGFFWSEPNAVYLNDGGVLPDTPGWISAEANPTFGIAVGDVDNNGYLDIVCANALTNNTLYLNHKVGLDDTLSWESDVSNGTIFVALADLDGNGYLDLVCGNGGTNGAPNTIYFNIFDESGGESVFSATPDWQSDDTLSITVGVAVADMNADGLPDVICGNNGQHNTIYFNTDSTLRTDPIEFTSSPNNTFEVVVGDVDGDGDKDIVCGNGGFTNQSNTLYRNDAVLSGVLKINPIPLWSGDEENSSTFGVELGDIDGDGDLDLISANEAQGNTIHLNTGGDLVFTQKPVWTSRPSPNTSSTFGVATGDVDGDGDFDVVFGNNEQVNTMYEALAGPVFKGKPQAPENHLANNGAFLRNVVSEPDTIDLNLIHLTFDAVDVESDSIYILPEYQFEGDPNTWFPADTEWMGLVGPLPTSPAGQRNSLEWDVSRVPSDDRDVVLRLRVISSPRRVSRIQHVSRYLKEIGTVKPEVGRIFVSPPMLSFETVTVGDMDTARLSIENVGLASMRVNSITLPSLEMRYTPMAPLDVARDSSDSLTVFLQPVNGITNGRVVIGDMRIYTTDPVNPITHIMIEADVRALSATSRVLTDSNSAPLGVPLGEAVTVIVSPDAEVRIDTSFIYHRPTGTTVPFDTIQLAPSGGDFIAVIPGAAVMETGLDYYIDIINGVVVTTLPPRDNVPDSVFYQAVEPPSSVASAPRPTRAPDEFLQSRDINVDVFLPDGSNFVSGTLYFRQGGESKFQSDTLSDTLQAGNPVGTIPGSAVGSRGVEYYVNVETETADSLTHPLTTIRVTLPEKDFPYLLPFESYRMFSIPFDMDGTMRGTLNELGEPNNKVWRMYGYYDSNKVPIPYLELPDSTIDKFEAGRAYWLITRKKNVRLNTEPNDGVTTPTDSAFVKQLRPKEWNMIGNPFDFPVAWDDIMVDTLTMAEAEAEALPVIDPPKYYVNGEFAELDALNQWGTRVIEPFEGYFVRNNSDRPVTLQIPPIEPETIPSPTPQPLAAAKKSKSDTHWRLRIKAESRGAVDGQNFAGVDPAADLKSDRLDRFEPPMSPGKSVAVYFPHGSWDVRSGAYAHDIRGEFQSLDLARMRSPIFSAKDPWGHAWRFDIAKTFSDEAAGDPVTIEILGVTDLPLDAEIYLIDRALDRVINIRTQNRYEYLERTRHVVSAEEDARFVVVVGSEAFAKSQKDQLVNLPRKTALFQNSPNPFNPTTAIRYEIAAPVDVTLRVYDAKGRLVKEVYKGRRRPGAYEAVWNGDNDQGQGVASGVYFYRLRAGRFSQTRKLVLLK